MIDALASLVDKSLVALDASGSGGVYRLLDTTRAYAREKLARSGEQDRVSRRHAEHARTLLLAAREIGAPSDARSIDDVRVALDWAFAPQGDEALGLKLTSAAIPLWFQLSLIDECFQRVQRALEIAEIAGDREAQLSTLYGLWNCRFLSSEFRECVSLAQRFSKRAEQSAEPVDRLIADRLIGVPLHYLGEQAEARQHLERMLESYVAPAGVSRTIRYQADQRVLARAARRALEDARRLAHPIWSFSVMTLAECPIALWVGDLAAAASSVESMRDLTARYEIGVGAGIVRCFEGAVCSARGEVGRGLSLLQEGLGAGTGRISSWSPPGRRRWRRARA